MAHNTTSLPTPIGPTTSFKNVQAGATTASFALMEGTGVITFRPYDVNDPGVMTLTNSDSVTVGTLNKQDYFSFQVPRGGDTYTVTVTKAAEMIAATNPTIWR